MIPVVTCTVNNKCVPVLASSVETYCPGVRLIVHKNERTNFGDAFNKAMHDAFLEYDEIIIANDDVVLTPTSYSRLIEDVEHLKCAYGDKLGIVAAHTDSSFPSQNIRFENGSAMDRFRCQWEWEKTTREADVVAPIFAWISKSAFEAAQFPPINWYSDDVICRDLKELGFRHFISRSYVHHVGSQTVGHDDGKNRQEAEPWLREYRPDYAKIWFGHDVVKTKKPIKICVYAISKNEEHFVERFVASASSADMILVADTGSTDGTVDACRKAGVTTHEICISPWRFDHARNAAIALIPRDIDVCVSIDMDEVLEPGWREEIERIWTEDTTRVEYYYEWGPGLKFRYHKIHARHGYHWHHPCHEVPVPDGRINEVYAHTDMQIVTHHPDPNKSRGQYLDLLELSVKEDPFCPRNAFYYARELSFHSCWEKSIHECNRYLSLPEATWDHERCYAYRVMGKCYAELGNEQSAEASFIKAGLEAPDTREPWCELAMLYYRQARWAECYAASMRALSIQHKYFVYTADPSVWGHWPHDLASISAWNLGLKDIALQQAEMALEKTPGDPRLAQNLEIIKKGMA